MRRGGFGKPYRPPPAGWPIALPPYSSVYSHKNPALNDLVVFRNTTSIQLQENQVGRPMTRPVPNLSATECEHDWQNGLPKKPWIGPDADQFLTSGLPGMNQFDCTGTTGGGITHVQGAGPHNDMGKKCRLRGFKNVQAYRQWHGIFGWTSHDPGGCADTYCAGATRYYEPVQLTADQTKYRTITYAGSKESIYTYDVNHYGTQTYSYRSESSISGNQSVDANSGLLSNTLLTEQTITFVFDDTSQNIHQNYIQKYTNGGAGYTQTQDSKIGAPVLRTNFNKGMTADVDADVGTDVHCLSDIQYLLDLAAGWPDSDATVVPTSSGWEIGPLTVAYDAARGLYNTLHIKVSRSATVYEWVADRDLWSDAGVYIDVLRHDHYEGSFTLSDENHSSDIYADGVHLLSFWDLTKDGGANGYPWRQDAYWQMAPLVTRDEAAGNVAPGGFLPYTMDNLSLPIADKNGNQPFTVPVIPPATSPPPFMLDGSNNNDANGLPPASDPANDGFLPDSPYYNGPVAWIPTYTQIGWYDVSACGFRFPAGRDATNCAALSSINNGLYQYALTGKIFGMPLPMAYENSESGLYQEEPGHSGTPISFYNEPKVDFQNFFDYRAKVWRACPYTEDDGGYVDFYRWGYGEWLYDVIDQTGAMLPHNATQWTNRAQAISVVPYAQIVQADKQAYDKSGSQGEGSDFRSFWGGGILLQKCCEIQEVWPSYNFARPAGMDKFSYDETKVYCVGGGTNGNTWDGSSGNGSTWSLTNYNGVPPASLAFDGIWGGKSVGGFYKECTYDLTTYSGYGLVHLGTKVFDVPSDWVSLSGDDAVCFGPLRFPTAPAILGRAQIVSVTDITSCRVLVTEKLTTLGLDVPQAETVDICVANTPIMDGGVELTKNNQAMETLAGTVVPTRIKRWKPSTGYTVGIIIIDSNGALQICKVNGTSDTTEPTWATSGDTPDSDAIWTFTLAGAFTEDTTFTVPTAFSVIQSAKYITSHIAGATTQGNWEWDDNQRKGDFSILDWTFNWRVPGEIARGAITTDCYNNTPPAGWPDSSTPGANGYDSFHQTQFEKTSAMPYTPCKPLVICISPNGETFGTLKSTSGGIIYGTNGITFPFPTIFKFDDLDGAAWQAEIEQVKHDFLWQSPHTPCGLANGVTWKMDDGTCKVLSDDGSIRYFAYPTLFESRGTPPTNGGYAGNETAPTLPAAMAYGDISSVSSPPPTNTIAPPGMIGFDPGSGAPLPAGFTIWGYRINIETSGCAPASCGFNYRDAENLLCLNPYEPDAPEAAPQLTGLGGLA